MKQRLRTKQAWLTLRFLSACLLIFGCGSCVRLPRHSLVSVSPSAPSSSQAPQQQIIDINLASPAELERLPGIGRGLAARITAHRAKYGRFRRPEHIMMVRGISDRRFRAMRDLIKAG